MRGIEIRDLVPGRGHLAVDLRHILDLLGERVVCSRWLASGVWATGEDTGEAAQELERLADGHTYIPGEQLSRIAHRLVQVIDGEFTGFVLGGDSPWVIIRAVDSTLYKVFSAEAEVLQTVRAAFQKVSDCEYKAYPSERLCEKSSGLASK